LIVSCDMPFLTREWLQFLCQRAERSMKQVVVAESPNGLEPLCACWKTACLPAVQAAFDSGVRRVSEAMKRLPMEMLDVSVWKRFDTQSRLFWNMNTPADYEDAKRILEAPQP
jgi:molybdopterin-guanine dinucleotide biosynthesis protein A